MESTSTNDRRKRARALHNFFQNQPRMFSKVFLGDGNIEEDVLDTVFRRIRNKAICSLIVKHGLSIDQVKGITLSDVDLVNKTVTIKSGHNFVCSLVIDDGTAEHLATYIRVRNPTIKTELFPVERGVDGFENLDCMQGQ